MKRLPGNEKGFFSLIGMLIVLGLIGYFVYYIMNNYFSPKLSTAIGPSDSNILPGNAGSNYQSVISGTKEKMEEVNKKSLDQIRQIEEMNK